MRLMIKQYTDSGVAAILKTKPELKNNIEWYETKWKESELRFIIDQVKGPGDLGEYLSSNKFNAFHKNINSFLDRKLPEGNICSIAAGTGCRELWLCSNSSKARHFYISDLYYNKYLKACENLFHDNCKKGTINVAADPVDVTNLPYEPDFFDAVFVGSVIYALDNEEIKLMLEQIKRILKPNGIAIIWCYSFITPLHIFKMAIKKMLGMPINRRPDGWKHCGYYRTCGEVNQIIQKESGFKVSESFKINDTDSPIKITGYLSNLINYKCLGYVIEKV